MDLHREATHSRRLTPFFLAECRRKTFACAYQSDKAFATFFDRPPCIPRCYADCKLPLNLADDQILLVDTLAALEQARSNLTEDGWNLNNEYRIVLAEFREEIIQYGPDFNIRPENAR